MKLRDRLLLLVLALVITPLVIVVLWNLKSIENQALRNNVVAMEQSLAAARQVLSSIEKRTHASASVISAHEEVHRYLRRDSLSERDTSHLPAVLRILSNYESTHSDFTLVAILDNNAGLDIGSGDESAITAILSEAIKNNILLRNNFHRWHRCHSGNGICLLEIQPVQLPDSTQQYATGSDITAGYIAIIVTANSISDMTAKYAASFGGALHLVDAIGNNWFSDVTLDALTPSEQLTEQQSSAGTVISLALKIDDNVWLQASAPKILQAHRDELRFNFIIVACIAGLICALLLMFILQRFIFDPLETMKQFASVMARGDYKTVLPTLRDDEIGDLGNALEAMRVEVTDSHSQIQNLAFSDPLTGLDNRAMFATKLSYIVSRSDPDEDLHALMFIDLDNFKQINDTMGHGAGDELLLQVANRLEKSVRTSRHRTPKSDEDAIARFGGDEFQLLLPEIEDISEASMVAERILKNMAKPFEVSGQTLHITVSVGAAIYPSDGVDVENLTKNADAAMYHAKNSGRNQFQYFSEHLNAAARRDLKMQSQLRDALINKRLSLVFQPKVDGATGAITGAEALARWHDEELGTVPPEQFVQIAENYGLMESLTKWLINEVCATVAEWRNLIADDFAMCLNVSGQDISRGNLPELLHQGMTRHGITGKHLTIELTESSLLEARSDPQQRLAEIRALGIAISLDDFGTGYSSLAYLRRLPIDELKIDRSFMAELSTEQRAESIVAAMGTLAEALEMEWTAEGVESVAQLRVIRSLKCNNVQGYLVSKPLSAEDFAALLSEETLPWLPHWKASQRNTLSIV